jgi:preprotein translocase subunit SecB
MAENTSPNGEGAPQAAQPAPRLSIVSQYVKDMSFENPRAPQGLAQNVRPEIQIRVDVRTAEMGEGRYEVVIDINVDAKSGDAPVFLVELSYGGMFELANIPPDSLQPLLQIECPRLLFPFARRVVADATRDGGFPPLMIDPIDFVTLFRRKLQAAGETAQD